MPTLLKRARSLLGQNVSKSPPTNYEHDPENPGRFRKIQARSPPVSEYMSQYQYPQPLHLNPEQEDAVNTMVAQINSYFNINVDHSDENIRWIIRKIISVHGLTSNCIELIQRCRPLLYAISNAVVTSTITASLGLVEVVRLLTPIVGGLAGEAARQTTSLAGEAASFARRRLSNALEYASNFTTSSRSQDQQHNGRARSVSPGRSRVEYAMNSVVLPAINFTTQAVSRLCSILLNILQRVSSILAQCVKTICEYLTTQQAVNQAVEEVAPQGQECAICMTGVEDGPLGYIVRHQNLATGHPDRFHRSCLRSCPGNRCPMCRQEGPVWSDRQAGGGLKKYRSKSKHNSKTRRLRKSRSKPRKSYKSRKPRCSSRRK